MRPTPDRTLSVLLLLIVVTVWLAMPANDSRLGASGVGTEPHAVSTEKRGNRRLDQVPSETPGRVKGVGRALPAANMVAAPGKAAASRPQPREAAPPMVWVRGQVRRRGLPVPAYDLSFHVLGEGLDSNSVEWDWTDEDGRFRVRLRPTTYAVSNDDEGPSLTRFRVPSGAEEMHLDIDLPTGELHGVVLDAVSGRPMDGARVVARRVNAELAGTDAMTAGLLVRGGFTRTADDGSFVLSDLSRGVYSVLAHTRGRQTQPRRVVIGDDPTLGLELVLNPGARLLAEIVGPDGFPAAMDLIVVPGETLSSLSDLDAVPIHRVGYDGRVDIEGLPPGPAMLFGVGTTDTYDMALTARIEVARNGRPTELLAQVCGTLVATAVRLNGAPIEKAYLDLRSHAGELVLGSLRWFEDGPTTDATGRLVLDDVMPGRYLIAAGQDGRHGEFVPVNVVSDRKARVTLVLD